MHSHDADPYALMAALPRPAAPRARIPLAVLILLLALASFRLSQWFTPQGTATSPDSLAYLYTARSLVAGQGLMVPGGAAFGPALEPMTLWAPLYPALLSLCLPLASDSAFAAAIANGACLVASALLLFSLCRRWLPAPASAAFALLTLTLPGLQLIYTYAWSEALCLPLLLGIFLGLSRYADAVEAGRGGAAWGWLACAAAATSATLWTRYAGVAFLPLLGLTIVWLAPREHLRRRLLRAGVAMALALAGAAPLLLRNFATSGHLSGGDRGASGQGAAAFASHLFGALGADLVAGQWWLAAAALVLAGELLRRRQPSPLPALPRQDDWRFPLGWAIGYLVLVWVMGRLQSIDDDARMASLAIPFVMLAAATLGRRVAELNGGRLGWLPLLAWCAALAVQNVDALRMHHLHWNARGTPDFSPGSDPMVVYDNFTRNAQHDGLRILRDAILASAGHDAQLFSDVPPLPMSFITGLRSRALPVPLDEAQLTRLGRRHGTATVLFASRGEGRAALEALLAAHPEQWRPLEVSRLLGAVVLQSRMPVEAEGS